MERSSKIFGRSEPRTNYFNEWELLRKTLTFYRLNSIFDQDNFYTYKLICQWFKCSCRLCYLFLFVCLSVCLSVCLLFIVYPCPYTYTATVDFYYTHMCFVFILLSTFHACMDHYFVLWRHTQFLFNGFSSVFLCACVCC